jgi:hypothetical protein
MTEFAGAAVEAPVVPLPMLVEPATVELAEVGEVWIGLAGDVVSVAFGTLTGVPDVPVALVDPVGGVLTIPFKGVAGAVVVDELVVGLLEGVEMTGCAEPVEAVAAR